MYIFLGYRAPQRDANQGLGAGTPSAPEDCDNEYEAYRKRMMLAYRFRPNPLVGIKTITYLFSYSLNHGKLCHLFFMPIIFLKALTAQ